MAAAMYLERYLDSTSLFYIILQYFIGNPTLSVSGPLYDQIAESEPECTECTEAYGRRLLPLCPHLYEEH